MMWTKAGRVGGLVLTLAAAGALTLLGACADKDKPRMPEKPPPVLRDVPAPLRGTVGSEASLRGADPVLVSGFGLVVGLGGTGGGDLPGPIQVAMERELAKGGIGRGGVLDSGPLAGKTPREVLRDPNVAVVIVEGAVPPGAPEGSTFDVAVRTLPGSTVTSLQGGTLWTTELRLGPATTYGQTRTRRLADARGPVMVNPFAGDESHRDAPSRTIGRVLGGGVVTEGLQMELVLDNESWSRATAIQSAINNRFPQGAGDRGQTARGRNASSLAISVPKAYSKKTVEFTQLLMAVRIDPAAPQEAAKYYVEELKRSPALAGDISLCLEALGKVAVPFLAPMYEYPEPAPRMAALRAGAKLGDARTLQYLRDMAMSGPPGLRAEAIELMGDLPTNPRVNLALWELVDTRELDVRVAAYEALAARGDPLVDRVEIPGKATVDMLASRDPLIYVMQQVEPRIVIFGDGLKLRRNALVSVWGDRLMLTSDSENDPVRLMYDDPRTDRALQGKPPEELAKFVEFLGHKSTPQDPAPGLNMSYSEMVGALYELQKQGGVRAAFATQRDRLLAQLYKASQTTQIQDRPDTTGAPVDDVMVFNPQAPTGAEPEEATKPTEPRRSMVVPLGGPVEPVKKGGGSGGGGSGE
jgi:flagellar basal body P-ring protein FlgI